MWERNKKLTFTPVTETIQSVYRGDKRYELSDHLGNFNGCWVWKTLTAINPAFKSGEHVVLTDRKELHCGLEDNVPFPEYYTAEVKNRYDYYPFGMLIEERKYGAATCIYDIDTTIVFTVIDQDFAEDPNLDAWLYAIAGATPNYDNSSMLLEYDQDPLVTYWPANEGDRYKVTFSFTFDGNCDSLQVLGNVQNSTTQSYTSSGTYTFDFTVNDVSGGYGVFGFYKENPECIVYIHWVKIEQYTTSTQVVCDTDSVAGYRFGFNGQMKDDEVYGVEGTAYSFEYRIYDSRIGRFLSVDPLVPYYPFWAPYTFAANTPIWASDLEGLEPNFERALEQQGEKLTVKSDEFIQVSIKRTENSANGRAPTLDDIQTFLDLVGLTPIVGEFADGVNGGIYLFRGKFKESALSFTAMIPLVGTVPTVAKWSRNVLKFSDNAFITASGLTLKLGSREGNRLSHVFAHAVNDLTKSKHGVFELADGEDLLSTIDKAWETAQKGGRNVEKTVQSNGNISYVIDMGKKVGYEGGSEGTGEALNKVQIIIKKGTDDELITAFPVK